MIVDNSSWNIHNFRMPLVRKLSRINKDVIVVSPVDEYIHYLNETNFIKHKPCKHLQPRSRNPFNDILLIIELLKIYYREKPDLIFHFTIKPNIYGNISARILGIPSISVITGLGYTFLHPKGLNRIVPWLYKFSFKKLKKLVFYNPDDQKVFIEQNIIPKSKCIVVPGSGVNTNHFRPLYFNKPKNPFVFLFIGRLLKDKGLIEFVEAAKNIRKKNKNIACWVVGDFFDANPAAISKDTLLEWVENKDILYLGKVMDVRQIIKKANVLVLPSYREGIPRVVLEAMSMGKPIITTEAAGCRETVIHRHNGFLVPPMDSKALSLAMSAMSEAPIVELKEMGKKSRFRVLKFFDEKVVIDCYLNLLHKLFPESFHAPVKRDRKKIFQ